MSLKNPSGLPALCARQERDGARRALAGVQVTVKATDSKDMTVQVPDVEVLSRIQSIPKLLLLSYRGGRPQRSAGVDTT